MGFLDKVMDVANKTADSAKHATAVGKEKFEDAKLSKKINDLCREIGELVVAQRRDEAPADANARIDTKVAQIAELEKQIEANANAVENPAPGTTAPPTTAPPTTAPPTEAAS